MKKIAIFFTVIFIFLVSSFSYSETFKWVDKDGIVHFSDDINSVPKEYRKQIKIVDTPSYPSDEKKDEHTNDKDKKNPKEQKVEQQVKSDKSEKIPK